jgi:type II secretion system (T2SS) protein G
MKAKPLINAGLLILAGLIVWGLMNPLRGPRNAARIAQCKSEIAALIAASNKYKEDYSSYPRGNGSEIIRSLLGNNPRKIAFFYVSPNRLKSDGVFLDPWGTAYQIRIEFETNFIVRSAGINRQFGDKDDETSTSKKPF